MGSCVGSRKARHGSIGRSYATSLSRAVVVERTLGTLRVYGFHRARSVGAEKVHGEAVLKAIAYKKRVKASRNSVKFSSFCSKRAASVKKIKKLMRNEI